MKIVVSNAPMNFGHPSGHVPPLPPHLRHEAIHIEEDESDLITLERIFEDRDTAIAAMKIMHGAPPEVKVLFVVWLKTLKKITEENIDEKHQV